MNKLPKRILTFFISAFFLFSLSLNVFSYKSSLVAIAADFEESGEIDGYTYEVWNQGNTGEYDFENTINNGFDATWDDIYNFCVHKGHDYERNTVNSRNVKEYRIEYDLDALLNGSDIVGVHGWLSFPMTELYIVEAWGIWHPPGDIEGLKSKGTVTVDDKEYDIYMTVKYDTPKDRYYPVYWSVARNSPLEPDKLTNLKGTIDVAAHFQAWADAGFDLGYLDSIQFMVEAYRSTGYAKLNSMDTIVDISDKQVTGPSLIGFPYEEHDPLPVKDNGHIIDVDFESADDKINIFNSEEQAEISDEYSYAGNHSMFIPVQDIYPGIGFCYELDPYDLPKSSDNSISCYMTGARIFNLSDKDIQFNIDMIAYHEDPSKTEKTVTIGKRICKAKQWTNIKDICFDFEHDPACKYKIIISPSWDEAADFYIDDFYIAYSNPEAIANQFVPRNIPGDLNDDGVVDSLDIIVCRKAVISSTGSEKIVTEGDVNGDCRSDVSDLVLICKYVMNISDVIPVSDEDAVLFFGDSSVYDKNGKLSFYVSGKKNNDDSQKTIIRKDGSMTAEWNDSENYYLRSFDDYTENHNSKKCNDVNIGYSANLKSDGHTDLMLCGTLINGYDSCDFCIYEGWTAINEYDDYTQPFCIPSNAVSITVNGTEYYMLKHKQSETRTSIEMYRKDNPLILGEYDHIENEINLGDFMKYWFEDEKVCDTVLKVGMYLESRSSSGYADFEKISFSD